MLHETSRVRVPLTTFRQSAKAVGGPTTPATDYKLTHQGLVGVAEEWCLVMGNYGAGPSDEWRVKRVVGQPGHARWTAKGSLAASDPIRPWTTPRATRSVL